MQRRQDEEARSRLHNLLLRSPYGTGSDSKQVMCYTILQQLEGRVGVESEGAKNSYLSDDGKPVNGEEFRARGYWHSEFQAKWGDMLELYVVKLQVDGPPDFLDRMRLVG
jgi:hypothetical protein